MDIGRYMDALVAGGRYHFTTDEAAKALDISALAARESVRRQRIKGRLAMPYRGFNLILPPEYRRLGCLPADQFLPQLMEHLGLRYYAGLLSAASFHGAAHQAPMVFQVVLAASRDGIRCGQVGVDFVGRRNVAEIPTEPRNTLRGILSISTPEATAFDLVGYPGHAGGLSNVATVLSELAEKLDAGKLSAEIPRSPLPWTQRLGHLLEAVGADRLAEPLAEHIARNAREYIPLRPGASVEKAVRIPRWRLLVNETVEADL